MAGVIALAKVPCQQNELPTSYSWHIHVAEDSLDNSLWNSIDVIRRQLFHELRCTAAVEAT